MCNPGRAEGPIGVWTRIIKTDKTLDSVEQMLRAAVALKISGAPGFSVSPDDYVQILNCCYVCDGGEAPASCLCGHVESVRSNWVWIAWGATIVTAKLIAKGIATVGETPAFWFDGSISKTSVGASVPKNCRAIHPHPRGWTGRHSTYPSAVAHEISTRL